MGVGGVLTTVAPGQRVAASLQRQRAAGMTREWHSPWSGRSVEESDFFPTAGWEARGAYCSPDLETRCCFLKQN